MANKKSKPKNSKKTTELEEDEKESIELIGNQDDVYRAEVILKTRIIKGKVQYYVKWWGSSVCTWEPKANILDQRLLKAFKEQNKNKSNVKKRVLNTGVERKNAKIGRPAGDTKNVEEKKRRKRLPELEENGMHVNNDKNSNKIKVRHANNVKELEENSIPFNNDVKSNKIKVGHANNDNPVRLPLFKKASKVLQKNGNSTEMEVRKEKKMALGGERKKTRSRPEIMKKKNNNEASVVKKKRGRPPMARDLMKPVGNRCEDARLLDCAKPGQDGICPSPVKVETIELNDNMDPPDHGKNIEIPKLVSEMESPEKDNKMESQGHNNETITIDDTCEAVYESQIPELAKYFPSPATNYTHRLGNSSPSSDATSPNPVSRCHPPQESMVAGVDSCSRNSQAINRHMFNVAAGPVRNYSWLPQSPLTTAAPGNNTRVSQSLQSVTAPSLGQNERTPQASTTLPTSPIGYNVRTPQGAATYATSPMGCNTGTPHQLVLPFYDGHLQDIGYLAPDDSHVYGNSLFIEDTFDYS